METQTLSEVFRQLDGITEELEKEDISLEDSFQLYSEGMKLLKIDRKSVV